jgi:ketosteroid isomerase-like protein
VSRENVEIVRRALDVLDFQHLDDDVMTEFFDPDVEWRATPESLLAATTYHGYDGISRFWRDLFSAWDRYDIEPREFVDLGEQVAVVTRIRARTRHIEVDEQWSALLTLRDGRIVRFEGFSTPEGARHAATRTLRLRSSDPEIGR